MSGPKKVVMETQPPETVAHRKKSHHEEINLKAKKLDIDFDALNDEEEEDTVPEPKEEYKKPLILPPSTTETQSLPDKMKYAKAISSKDYEAASGKGASESDIKEKLSKMSNSQGISSSDFYPEQAPKKKEESRLNKIKDAGANLLSSAAEGAKGLGSMASNFIKSIRKGSQEQFHNALI